MRYQEIEPNTVYRFFGEHILNPHTGVMHPVTGRYWCRSSPTEVVIRRNPKPWVMMHPVHSIYACRINNFVEPNLRPDVTNGYSYGAPQTRFDNPLWPFRSEASPQAKYLWRPFNGPFCVRAKDLTEPYAPVAEFDARIAESIRLDTERRRASLLRDYYFNDINTLMGLLVAALGSDSFTRSYGKVMNVDLGRLETKEEFEDLKNLISHLIESVSEYRKVTHGEG